MNLCATILLFLILVAILEVSLTLEDIEDDVKFQCILSLVTEWRSDLRDKLLDMNSGENTNPIEMTGLLKMVRQRMPNFECQKFIDNTFKRSRRIWTEIDGKGELVLNGETIRRRNTDS